MPAGNPLGYFTPDMQQQLLSALLGMSMGQMGGTGGMLPLMFGGSGSSHASFMGVSTPAPQPTAVQGPRLQDLSIQQLNALYRDPRVQTQAQRNKIGAMVQQKQMQAMQPR